MKKQNTSLQSTIRTSLLNPSGYSYSAKVVAGGMVNIEGYACLSVICYRPDSSEQEESVSMELNAAECRSLAKLLMAAAELLE